MSTSKLIKIRLSLKGRPIKSYAFNQPVITVGRNPEADIVLDNAGVSRDHLKIEQTPGGYYAAEDLTSANGTFVNGEKVTREYLMNNDVVRVGKFSMWIGYEEDRRADRVDSPGVTANAFQGTTVLSVAEMGDMIEAMGQENEAAPRLEVVPGIEGHAVTPPRPLPTWLPVAMAVGGALVGAVVVWMVMGGRG